MPNEELVYFDGPFSMDEKRQIGRAIHAVEQELPSLRSSSYGRPWVAVSVEIAGYSRLLIVHRIGTPQSIRASSAEELVGRIQALPNALRTTSQ